MSELDSDNGGRSPLRGTITVGVSLDFATGALRVERPRDLFQMIVAKGLLMEAMRQIDAELDQRQAGGTSSRLWMPGS